MTLTQRRAGQLAGGTDGIPQQVCRMYRGWLRQQPDTDRMAGGQDVEVARLPRSGPLPRISWVIPRFSPDGGRLAIGYDFDV